jgi:hypothetical protein
MFIGLNSRCAHQVRPPSRIPGECALCSVVGKHFATTHSLSVTVAFVVNPTASAVTSHTDSSSAVGVCLTEHRAVVYCL